MKRQTFIQAPAVTGTAAASPASGIPNHRPGTSRRSLLQALAGAALGPRAARAAPSKPNIVIFLADDLGHGDLGVTGCPDIRTPHLDRMAAEGVYFTHAYANAPVCSPTRAALLTGRYQQRAGLDGVIYVQERDRGLSLQTLLLPQVLKDAGYVSGIVGKWHLGFRKEYFPTRRGFDYFFGFLAGNIDYFAHTDRLGNQDLWRNEEPVRDSRYMTDLIGDESIRFIDRNLDRPFFLYVPFSAPHDPFQGPEDRASAGNREITMKVNRTRAVYRAMVESMDHNIGRILGHLSRRGLDERTAVFFMSDNGGLPEVARNAPFQEYKTSLWEGGIRTPLLARWRGELPAGTKVPLMSAGMDLFPTALELAGARVPEDHKLDGVSLLPAARGKSRRTHDVLFFHYDPPERKMPWRAMVREGWKYLRDRQGAEYLFFLPEDVAEKNDLSPQEPERFARMKRQYEAWSEDVFRDAPPG